MPARRSNVVRVEALKGRVVVTRESGKNAKLAGIVEAAGLESLEMPLIETVVGPDRSVVA
jgi:uroporphyrinogen-III synthase